MALELSAQGPFLLKAMGASTEKNIMATPEFDLGCIIAGLLHCINLTLDLLRRSRAERVAGRGRMGIVESGKNASTVLASADVAERF